MTNELSIESIKKELTTMFLNNMDILGYLEIGKYLESGYKISDIHNLLILDHDNSDKENNYISVEAEEYEFSDHGENDRKRYKIIIRMGLEKQENLDGLSVAVKKVVSEIYPGRKNYSNIPFYTKKWIRSNGYEEINVLHRMIMFEIEADTLR